MNLNKLLLIYKKAKAEMGEKKFNKKVQGHNISCGDEVTLFLDIDEKILKNISFKGSGCAIGISSSYLLSKLLKGKPIDFIKKLSNENYLKLVDMEEVSKSRKNCVLTPFIALKQGLE